ncbi:MAG: hypothetical protein QM767_22180 [Anaeromyxobacter sp.]
MNPGGLGFTTSYAYDAKGQQIQRYRSAKVHRHGDQLCDLAGHVLTQAVDPTGLNLVTRYEYDPAGRSL